ncbi:MAG: FAD-dependent monooxygenase [Ideonella sp.]|nr:FAD-dependent monooxygenase [Ideonella sp.]
MPQDVSKPVLTIAVVGAGPVGLALALHAAQQLPEAHITLFDARPAERDVAGDPRTLALSLGSVQLLQRLGVWPERMAQPILQVHVSQAPPTLDWGTVESAVHIRASEEKVPMLGAVLSYGQVVAPMQAAWLALAASQPRRLATRFGTSVSAIKPLEHGVEVDAGVVEAFDLAVIAEGGVFAEQDRKSVTRDYAQAAWVGTVTLTDTTPGLAVERFTRNGPLALLPLRDDADQPADGPARAALVWCVPVADDPVADLTDAQRLTVLRHSLPDVAGQLVGIGPLKRFALGLNAERTLVDGATVRIGNAAQTLHPVAGQGMNLGLRDAFELVQALRREFGPGRSTQPPGDANALARPPSMSAALRRVEWSRAPDRWAMIAATDFLARSFTWRWPGLPAARGLALALLQAVPPLKSALARQMMFGRR